MDLNAHITAISGFHDLSEADRVRFFAWFVHTSGKAVFEQADITACYRTAGVARPDVGPYLRKMVERSPPELIKVRGCYQLERRALEQLDERYGQRAALVKVDEALGELTTRIANAHEQVFFDE